MLKKFLVGLLVITFSFGLTGVVLADYGGENIFDSPFADVEQGYMDEAEGNLNTEEINPLFCTEELVEENEHVAKNDCTQDDLDINMAG
jgi:hypothetical protein